jgi:hypothetical protein
MDLIHNNTFSKFKFTMIMDLLITMNSSIYRQSRIFSITTTCILNYCEIVPSMQFKPFFFSSARKVIQYFMSTWEKTIFIVGMKQDVNIIFVMFLLN